ncbi:hypothetical protein L2135_09950, partial [Corynebacterium diphtheriae bv. mitis]|nr:hypothetical protein [Corynebacterium diphtheriae bv. mitis]
KTIMLFTSHGTLAGRMTTSCSSSSLHVSFILIPIPTHNKDGNQKYIGTLLSSQTTRTHNTNHHHNDDQNFAVNETLTPDEHKVKQDQHFSNFVLSEQPLSVDDSL